MSMDAGPSSGRLRRLAEELDDEALHGEGTWEWNPAVLVELDHALRPPVHERRAPSFGAIVEATIDPADWQEETHLNVSRRWVDEFLEADARRYAEGASSWMVRHPDGRVEVVVFDRPTGSERDLVVLAAATGGTIIQRNRSGTVRLVGDFGVVRWDGLSWHHEPPLAAWVEAVSARGEYGDRKVLARLLAFAVHDLGAAGVGALLVYRPQDDPVATFELRLPTPPPFEIGRPEDLAPLRHVLALVDGAAVFDGSGTLAHLGVRLVPSAEAEADVDGFGGMRHTSARRYSYDDPSATLIAVSEDGPVTVLRNGELLERPVAKPQGDG